MSARTGVTLELFESLLKEASRWPYTLLRFRDHDETLIASETDDENLSSSSSDQQQRKRLKDLGGEAVASGDEIMGFITTFGLGRAAFTRMMRTVTEVDNKKEEEKLARETGRRELPIIAGADLRNFILTGSSSCSSRRVIRCPPTNEEEAQEMDQLFLENFHVLTEFFPSLTLPHDTCREFARRLGCFKYGQLSEYNSKKRNVKFLNVDTLWFGPYLYHIWDSRLQVEPITQSHTMEHLYRYLVAASEKREKNSRTLLKCLWNTSTGRCFLLKQAVIILEDLLHYKFPDLYLNKDSRGVVLSRIPECVGDDVTSKDVIDTRISLLTRILSLETCFSKWYVDWRDQSRLTEIEASLALQKRYNRKRERLCLDGDDSRNLHHSTYTDPTGRPKKVDPLSVVSQTTAPPTLPLPSWIPQAKAIHRQTHSLNRNWVYSSHPPITDELILNPIDVERLYRCYISRALIHILDWKFETCGDKKQCDGRGKAWKNSSEKLAENSGNYAKIKVYRYIRHETSVSKTILRLCFKNAAKNSSSSSSCTLGLLPEDVVRGPIFDFLFGEQVGYPTRFFSTFKWSP